MTQIVSGFTVPAGSDPVSSIDDTLVTFAGEVRAAITAATEIPTQTGNAGKYLKTDGSVASWATVAGGGKVLQVVAATTTTQVNITSTTYTDTGLSATITPSATTSRILAIITQPIMAQANTATASAGVRLLRGSTTIADFAPNKYEAHAMTVQGAALVAMRTILGISWLDSPASTSALTYKTQGALQFTTSSSTMYFQETSAAASIILLEIGA